MYIIYSARKDEFLIVHPFWSDRPGYVNVEGSHGHNYDLPVYVIAEWTYVGEL